MDIGNVEIPNEMIWDSLNITIWSIIRLKLNGRIEVYDIWLEFGDSKYAQSSRPEKNDPQIRGSKDKKDII